MEVPVELVWYPSLISAADNRNGLTLNTTASAQKCTPDEVFDLDPWM